MKTNIAASTQNLAFNALIFLYKHVLKEPLEEKINAVRAPKKVNVPMVMTREEVIQVISLMQGHPQLVVKLLYCSGLRVKEALRLRIFDVDFKMKQLTVRSGKGNKDRVTTFPAKLIPALSIHLKWIKSQHDQDLRDGFGSVYLPFALSRKYPNADKAFLF